MRLKNYICVFLNIVTFIKQKLVRLHISGFLDNVDPY